MRSWEQDGIEERAQERISPCSGIVKELEEGNIFGKMFLRDTAMGAEPGAEERPHSFDSIGMNFAKAITIIVTGIFAVAVADGFVGEAPRFHAVIDVVFIGIGGAAPGDELLDKRLDGNLLHIGA